MSELQRFTINREQAINKMREYALRHPDQWVLELVQAAVLLGGRQIAVDVKAERLRFSWVGGQPLTTESLERLFDYLFVRSADPIQRGLQQVALGLNALLQQRASDITVRSGDGTDAGSVCATLQRNGSITVRSDASLVGTTLSVGLRKQSFFSSLLGTWETANEVQLLRERCTYVPVPIFVDGTPLRPHFAASLHAANLMSSVRIDDGPLRAVIGLASDDVAPEIVFVVGGVVITRKPVPELGERTAGVVWDDRLRKTADGADIVMDETYQQTLAACQQAVLPLLRTAHASVSTSAFSAPNLPGSRAGLPDRIAQVSPRPDVSLQDIDALPNDAPLFVVDPDSALATNSVLDPESFPWPVLLLGPTHNAAMSERFPDRQFARLTTGEDARFLRDLRQRTHPRRVTEPVHIADMSVRVEIDRTATQHAVASTPLLHRWEGRTQTLHSLQPSLPGMRILVNAEVLPDRSHLLPAVRQALAEVLPQLDSDPIGPVLRQAIAVAWALPTFVRGPGPPRVVLHLPREMQAVEPLVLHEPIATGPSAHEVAAVMGTPNSIRVPEQAIASLWPLESRLGVGHLDTQRRNTQVITAMGAIDGQWTWLDLADGWALDSVSDVLVLVASLTPEIEWDGWSSQPSPLAGVVHLTRNDQPPCRPTAGMALMGRVLDAAQPETWPAHERDVAMAVARRVQIQLGHPPSALRWVPGDPSVQVRPLGGLDDPDPKTVALTLDEAIALYDEADVPLRLDDPMSAWTDPGDSALVRTPIETEWGSGWLALPKPFDPTLGVLWTHQGQDVPVPSMHAHWPCRGHIQAAQPLQPTHIAQLHLMARGLYRQIDGMQGPDADAYRRHARPPSPPAHPERALERTLREVLGCKVAWRAEGETTVTRDAMRAVHLSIGAPHREPLADETTRGMALMDVVRRVCEETGADVATASLAVSAAWWRPV